MTRTLAVTLPASVRGYLDFSRIGITVHDGSNGAEFYSYRDNPEASRFKYIHRNFRFGACGKIVISGFQSQQPVPYVTADKIQFFPVLMEKAEKHLKHLISPLSKSDMQRPRSIYPDYTKIDYLPQNMKG